MTPLVLLEDGTQLVLVYSHLAFPDRTLIRATSRGEILWSLRIPGSANWSLVSETGQIFVVSTAIPFVTSHAGRIPPSKAGWPTYNGPIDGSRRMTGQIAPGIHVEPVRWLPDTGFHLAIGCVVGRRYAVQSSSDLKNWVTITNFTAHDRRMFASDTDAADGTPRLYRALEIEPR